MDCNSVSVGLRVKTVSHLGDTIGMLVVPKHLNARRPNAIGIVKGYVPGHGGDVWWVEHPDGAIGAYVFNEFNPEVESVSSPSNLKSALESRILGRTLPGWSCCCGTLHHSEATAVSILTPDYPEHVNRPEFWRVSMKDQENRSYVIGLRRFLSDEEIHGLFVAAGLWEGRL